MKKLLISSLAVVSLLMTSTVALANPRHGHHGGHYHGHHGGHYHGHHRPNYGAYVAGAVALGILGAVTYDYYGRKCYTKIVGYDVDGDPIVRKICE